MYRGETKSDKENRKTFQRNKGIVEYLTDSLKSCTVMCDFHGKDFYAEKTVHCSKLQKEMALAVYCRMIIMLLEILHTMLKENLVIMIMVMQLYWPFNTPRPMIQIVMIIILKWKILMQQNHQQSHHGWSVIPTLHASGKMLQTKVSPS